MPPRSRHRRCWDVRPDVGLTMKGVNVKLACGREVEFAPLMYADGWEFLDAIEKQESDPERYRNACMKYLRKSLERAGHAEEQINDVFSAMCIGDFQAAFAAALYGRALTD